MRSITRRAFRESNALTHLHQTQAQTGMENRAHDTLSIIVIANLKSKVVCGMCRECFIRCLVSNDPSVIQSSAAPRTGSSLIDVTNCWPREKKRSVHIADSNPWNW